METLSSKALSSTSSSSSHSLGMEERFWSQIEGSGWITYSCVAVTLLFAWQFISRFLLLFRNYCFRFQVASPLRQRQFLSPSISSFPSSQQRISEIITDLDLKNLMDNLDETFPETEKWESVIDKRNNSISYNVKCCKPKDGGPMKYLSVTVFKFCSAEMLRDFYMDNFYRKEWDKTIIDHEQLHVDESNGTEIGRTIKKFPFLTPREYILAWRLWEGRDRTHYCYSKDCDHPLAPRQKKHVRVAFLRSGWRIREVPGGNACEIKMVHQEDAGLNIEMAKLIFAKGIWSYVCKMDNALRKYSAVKRLQLTSAVSAITLVQKVPSVLDIAQPEASTASTISCKAAQEGNESKLSGRLSKKVIAKRVVLVGGIICLSLGHTNLSAKIAMAYILSKLTKHGASSRQSKQPSYSRDPVEACVPAVCN